MEERDTLTALSVFTGLFILISACACPTVNVGDCGELSSCAHTLSIAHPPGFPVYCILYKAFGEAAGLMGCVAFRHNILSSALTAGAAALLLATLRTAGISLLGALSGAIAFGLSSTAAVQGMQSEVYALNLFLVALTVHAVVRVCASGEPGKAKAAAYAGFCLGLALANHPYLALTALAPCVILASRIVRPIGTARASWGRALAIPALAMMPGLISYLYLPLRSAWNPPLMWGSMNTAGEVLSHMARTRYGGYAINGYSFSLFASQVWAYFVSFVGSMGWIASLLAVAGFGLAVGCLFPGSGPPVPALARACMLFFLVCGLSTVLAPIILINYKPDLKHLYVLEPFFSQSHFFLAGLGGFAISRAIDSGPGGIRLAMVLLVFMAAFGVSRVTAVSMAGEETARDYAVNILRCVPRNAHVLSQGDLFYMPWLYVRLVEEYRTDVNGFQANGFVFQDDPCLFTRLMDRAALDGGTYFTNADDCPDTGPDGWKPVPHGLVYKATKKALEHLAGPRSIKPPPLEWLNLEYLQGETADYMVMGVRRDTNMALAEGFLASGETREALNRFIMAGEAVKGFERWRYNLGSTLMSKGFHTAAIPYLEEAVRGEPAFEGARASLSVCLSEGGNIPRAVRVIREGIPFHGETRGSMHNLGALYVQADMPELAAEHYRKSLALDPAGTDAAVGLFRTLGRMNRWEEIVREVLAMEERGKLSASVAGWGAAALVRLKPSDRRILYRGVDWAREWIREEPGRDTAVNALSILTGLVDGDLR